MRTPVQACCVGALVLCLACVSAAEVPADRQATTSLGDPVECTEDARDRVTTRPFAVPSPELPEVRRHARPEGYVLVDSLVAKIFIPHGGEYCIRFDPARRALRDTLVPYTLAPAARAAIEIAPSWLREDMENNLRQVGTLQQEALGNLLLGLDDPRTIDEVAFSIAHLSTAVFYDIGFAPEVLEQNAELMYQIDEELGFVEIVDYDLGGGDFYSTTRYRTVVEGDTTEIEIPRETYYWWVAMPKVSDEMVLMDASVYDMHWREYLYYENDPGYPLLRNVVQRLDVVWDGIRHDWPGGRAFTDSMLVVDAIGNWCSHTVPSAASGNRPIQPNQIAHEHNGNCGELQDLLCAAARTCLIPASCVMDILEDHVWCETWLGDWQPYQVDLGGGPTPVANPGIAYDADHGGGKACSCIWSWRNDGYTYDVVGRYSETCTLTVYVDDPSGLPVDNAAVVLASEFYYAPYPLYRGTWGETDQNGTVSFVLGEDQNYYLQIHTSIGDYPESGFAELITASVPGEHYYFGWTTTGAMPHLNITEATPGTNAPYVIEVEYELPCDVQSGRDYYASPIDYYAEMLPVGHLDSFFVNQQNYALYRFRFPFTAYELAEAASAAHVLFHVPAVADYYFILSGVEHHKLATLANVKARLWLDDTVGVPEDGGAAVASLARPFPNPAGPGVSLAVTVPREADVTLRIYDVRGALVRTLADERLGAGRHERRWDGRDDGGRAVAGGVYFARMEAGGTVDTRKLALVR